MLTQVSLFRDNAFIWVSDFVLSSRFLLEILFIFWGKVDRFEDITAAITSNLCVVILAMAIRILIHWVANK